MSDNHDHSHFVVPTKYYVGAFIALLFLTFVTVYIARFDFGQFNLLVAMLVAVLKASVVVMIFMGMKWEKGFNFVAFIGSLLFVLIFILFTFSDVAFRKYTDPVEAEVFGLDSPVNFEVPSGGGH